MARFDLYRSRDGTMLLDCQNDLLSYLNTRIVVPLASPDDAIQVEARLNPLLDIDGDEMVMLTHFAAAVPISMLGKRTGSAIANERAIAGALDLLLSGY
ncbi:CcdB family protein [Sphingomonas sp. 37zxx]|uniref:CcdB family protein n=1 Tax=Sphingomonas sp. 37zxx TaxID=1550073 RepID=UPI00053BE49C|nr:CcdB family protein [Sphingomonas sp. 37zxx]